MGAAELAALVRWVAAGIAAVWAFRAAGRRDAASATVAIVIWHALVTHP